MRPTAMKVGELARRTGISVRTLHYYDEIGLLSPSQHSEAGHRLYGALDVVRLGQIRSLRQLGFSLEEIRDCLDRLKFSPQRVIAMHIARLQEQITAQRRLCDRLEAIAANFRSTDEISVEQFIETIEVINMMEQHFTPEQLKEIKHRGQLLGEERIRAVEAEWPELIAQVRTALDSGADPVSEPVQLLARRWMALVDEFTGGNPEIARALRNAYQQDPTFGRPDMDPRMNEYMEYISRATAAAKQAE